MRPFFVALQANSAIQQPRQMSGISRSGGAARAFRLLFRVAARSDVAASSRRG
jgi:hypothetical protein